MSYEALIEFEKGITAPASVEAVWHPALNAQGSTDPNRRLVIYALERAGLRPRGQLYMQYRLVSHETHFLPRSETLSPLTNTCSTSAWLQGTSSL